MIRRLVLVPRLRTFDAGRIGDVGECDALAVRCGVPNSHIEQHGVLIEGHESCNDLMSLVVLNGTNESGHLVGQSLLRHSGKFLHNWTVSRIQVQGNLQVRAPA